MSKRILLVDDEEGARKIIQFSLEAAAGWQVIVAASGMEGVTIAQEVLPDAILLDVMMPVLDGPATFQELQKSTATQHIPVIMLTAKAIPSEQQQLMALGIAGIITKPFKVPTLISQIRAILHWHNE